MPLYGHACGPLILGVQLNSYLERLSKLKRITPYHNSIMAQASVIAGTASADLAKKIAKKLGARLIRAEARVFADGEAKLTLSGAVPAGRAVIVQSAYPPVDTNLLRAVLLVSKAKERASEVVAVMPYVGYARQDREFLRGEIITAKAVGRMLKAAGASRVVTVDIHSREALAHLGPRAVNVSAIPELARHFKELQLRDPLAVSPDRGGAKRAAEFAMSLGCGHISLDKKRDRRTGKVAIAAKGAKTAAGRDVILVDDMISTGGSIAEAARLLKGQGCRKIHVACTHALLVNGAAAKIKRAGVSSIISANTIPGKTAQVDVSGVVAGALR